MKKDNLLQVIFVLRLLLLKDSDKWKTAINPLMDHSQERYRDDRATWDKLQLEIVDYLRKDLKLADLFTEAQVQKCIGIVRINAIKTPDLTRPGAK